MSPAVTQLRPYQSKGAEFARRKIYSLLAFDCGLGKTATAIRAVRTPCLVICPASVVIHWKREVERWAPRAVSDFDIYSYSDKALQIEERVDLSSYESLIVDEVHYIKNPLAKRTKTVGQLIRRMGNKGGKVIGLSGTLIPNRPIELWPVMFAMRMTDLKYHDFATRYAGAFWGEWGLDVRGSSHLEELRRLLAPHCYRVKKKHVAQDLPAVTRRVVDLSVRITTRKGAEVIQFKSLSLDELKGMSEPVAFEAMSDVLHLQGLLKAPKAIEYIKDLLAGGVGNVVVFAYHRDVIKSLAEGLKEFDPLTVTGDDSITQRQDTVDFFQHGACRVFIGQRQAAGTGTDGLQFAASHMVIVEASWVPGDLEQMEGRLHRMGQLYPVMIDYLTIEGSIDQTMLRRALEKKKVIREILPEDDFSEGLDSLPEEG